MWKQLSIGDAAGLCPGCTHKYRFLVQLLYCCLLYVLDHGHMRQQRRVAFVATVSIEWRGRLRSSSTGAKAFGTADRYIAEFCRRTPLRVWASPCGHFIVEIMEQECWPS